MRPCGPSATGGATGSAAACSTCAATRQPRKVCAPSAAGAPRSTAAERARRAGSASGRTWQPTGSGAVDAKKPEKHPPGIWCTQCGARPGLAAPAWICRVCVAGGPHKQRRRARERYRAAGLCARCGRERDRQDRRNCARCRRREADAQTRYRTTHPTDRERLYADARERRRRRIAVGLCAECTRERDREDRKLCARCRHRAADKQRAHRKRRQAGEDET